MRKYIKLLSWLLLLIIATLLRYASIKHGIGVHPDESDVASKSFDITWSNLSPPTFYYGSLVYYVPFLFKEFLKLFGVEVVTFEQRIFYARIIGLLFGVLGVLFAGLLAKSLSKKHEVGLASAMLLACNPLHIQLSHFYTSDIMVTTTGTAALWMCSHYLNFSKLSALYAAVVLFGISFCFKLSGITLALPIALTFLLATASKEKKFSYLLKHTSVCLLLLFVTLLVCQPYMFTEFERFKRELGSQVEMVRGDSRMPWNNQYQNTSAYTYQLKEMAHFIMGWPIFLSSALGMLAVIFNFYKKSIMPSAIILLWTVVVFAIIGRYVVKFDRYLLPIVPMILYFSVHAIEFLTSFSKNKTLRYIFLSLMVLWSLVPGLAFARIYNLPHVHELASEWICRNINPGKIILQIDWDTQLPKCSHMINAPQYQMDPALWQIDFYKQPAAPSILNEQANILAKGDYIVFPSARVFRGIFQVSNEYPQSSVMLNELLHERLGYKLLRSFSIYPRLGPYTLYDDLADESFTVHDHPKVLFFENKEKLSAEQIMSRVMNINPTPNLSEILLLEEKK